MPKWIHERAMCMKKDMSKTYGPEKAEQVAFAVATQQAHRLGKSPKKFKSKETGKMERFGTPEGRAVAKAKFDKPRSEYKKTAAEQVRMLSPDYVERVGKTQQRVAPHVVGGIMGVPLAVLGGAAGDILRGPASRSKLPVAAGAALGGAAGYGLGRLAWHRQAGGRDFGKAERRAALSAIRKAKAQGYDPVLVDKRSEADFDKIREILRKKASAGQIKMAAFADELYEIMTC